MSGRLYYSKGKVIVEVKKVESPELASKPWGANIHSDKRSILTGYKSKKSVVEDLTAMGYTEHVGDPETEGWIKVIHES